MSIVELPEVLCIHLKRFRYDAYISTNKISRHIKFPLTGLSMVPFLKQGCAAGGGHLYNLDAVITHYGGAGGEWAGTDTLTMGGAGGGPIHSLWGGRR